MQKYFLGTLSLLVMFIAFSVVAGAQESRFKEGKWSMTMVTKMENMSPDMAAAMKQMENMPPEAKAAMQQMQEKMGVQMSGNGQGMTMTTTHCITKQHPVPNQTESMEGCQQTHEINGDTVNFHLTCDRSDFQMESTGSMTYTGDTMQGHIKSHQVRASRTMDSTIDVTGQYLGPC